MARVSEPIQLPQVNPGNVTLAFEAVRTAPAHGRLSPEWLSDFGINQPRQVLGLLRFLGLVDACERLSPSVIEARLAGPVFRGLLADRVRVAYAAAGCGTAASLGWLGRDRLSTQDIRERITLRGPLAHRDLKRGGAKNAFYTLAALHELLLTAAGWGRLSAEGEPRSDLEEPRAAAREQAARSPNPPPLMEARREDVRSARDLVWRTFEPRDAGGESGESPQLVIPFAYRPGGQPVVARIQVEGPLQPGDLARLGRVLQVLGEEMAAGPDRSGC